VFLLCYSLNQWVLAFPVLLTSGDLVKTQILMQWVCVGLEVCIALQTPGSHVNVAYSRTLFVKQEFKKQGLSRSW
jgi:hypothetical protein